MAAAAYYQQLSLSFGGGGASNHGIGPAQCLPLKECQSPSQIAAALAANPYLFQSLASPPCSANGTSIPFTPIPIPRYLPQEPTYTNNTPFNNSLPFNPLQSHINSQQHVIPSNTRAQNGLRSQEEQGEKMSEEYQAAVRGRLAMNEHSFMSNNYANLPTAWHMNQLHHLKKGKNIRMQ